MTKRTKEQPLSFTPPYLFMSGPRRFPTCFGSNEVSGKLLFVSLFERELCYRVYLRTLLAKRCLMIWQNDPWFLPFPNVLTVLFCFYKTPFDLVFYNTNIYLYISDSK